MAQPLASVILMRVTTNRTNIIIVKEKEIGGRFRIININGQEPEKRMI